MKKLLAVIFAVLALTPLLVWAQSSWSLKWANSSAGADTILGQISAGRSMIAGVDLNKNGKPEVYVTAYTGRTVAMFEYSGSGDTLKFVQLFPYDSSKYGLEPRDIHFGDLDNDGNMEIIYPVGRIKGDFPDDEHIMYRGYEDWEWSPDSGRFLGPYTIIADTNAVVFRPENFYVADVDGDGQQELIDPGFGFNGIDDKLNVLSISGSFETGFYTINKKFSFAAGTMSAPNAFAFTTVVPAKSVGGSNQQIWFFGNGESTPYTYIGNVQVSGPTSYTVDTTKTIVLKVNNNYPLKQAVAADFDGDGTDEVYFDLYRNVAGNPAATYPSVNSSKSLWVIGGLTNPAQYDSTNLHEIWVDTTAGTLIGMAKDSAGKRLFVSDYSKIWEIDYTGGNALDSSSYKEKVIYQEPQDAAVGAGVTGGIAYADMRGDGKKELVLAYQGVTDSLNKSSGPVKVLRILEETATGIWKPWTVITPTDYKVNQNYPNPFNPSTTISFSLPVANKVSVRIYDVQGKEIRTLIDNSLMSKGSHSVVWDGRDSHGINVASGVYLYTLEFGGYRITKKMTLLK